MTGGSATGGGLPAPDRAGLLPLAGLEIEYAWYAPAKAGHPPLVLLHEGLGCVGLWRHYPARLAARTGAGLLVYSRHGHGRSTPLRAARRVDFMHREALDVLPALLDRFALAAPVLVGHSDGASIAIIHAARAGRPVRALVLEAPHLFVEPESIAGCRQARARFETTDMAARMARHHRDPVRTFRGWNDIWLDPGFAAWNIEDCLPAIRCPILAVQGEADEYGTLAQIEAIDRRAGGPVRRLILPGCGHSPHREAAGPVLEAVARFLADHAGGSRCGDGAGGDAMAVCG